MSQPKLHEIVARVTDRIMARSEKTRSAYLTSMRRFAEQRPRREKHDCAGYAHAIAAAPLDDRKRLQTVKTANLGIVTAYNDMLSAHAPYATYPDQIKRAARDMGAVAQVAGGVPAMCDGITQGTASMELSLLSRDVIALSTAIALSHEVFDGALMLGICDKIVPGLLIGALRFGYLPVVFVPAGPMGTGLSGTEKTAVRQRFAAGQASRDELLEAESKSYHSQGTCTFYGTANTNQLLMDVMGLHVPGAAFVPPGVPLREALTRFAVQRLSTITALGDSYTPMAEVVSEKSLVNAMVVLLATGGSTNHTLHIPAIARAAGVLTDWEDLAELSRVVPLIVRAYPNGKGDVNDLHRAGGTPFVVRELLSAGLLHDDVRTVMGQGLSAYTQFPEFDGELRFRPSDAASRDESVLRSAARPFDREGGLCVVSGKLGRGVLKTSAVAEAHRVVRAPALVFDSQEQMLKAFKDGELERDFVAVLRFQGPKACGMPELHKLTPALGVLQDRGFHVALVTDGRMSGASGKVPAAIHVTPECLDEGPLGRVRDGDVVTVDATRGLLDVELSEQELMDREPARAPERETWGVGRELFEPLRAAFSGAQDGALSLPLP
jgi:phosphogluconate dehydratase